MNNRPNLPKNPLQRDGVSQRQRLTPALAPDSRDAAQVDERDLADFLVLAYQLSEQVHYYRLPGRSPGNPNRSQTTANTTFNPSSEKPKPPKFAPFKDSHWQAFFENSTPVQIALISKERTLPIKRKYDACLMSFIEHRTSKALGLILQGWQQEILHPIQHWYNKLGSYTPLRSVIKGLVNTNLGEAIALILSLEQAYRPNQYSPEIANANNLLDTFYRPFLTAFDLRLTAEQINTPPMALSLESATIRDELDGIFQDLFQVYRQIIHQAPTYLAASLSDRSDHPPHLAMYVAMFDVLQPARDDLNRMTQRHLDFFYRQVLNLPARPATPDYTHLLFELAKPQREYRLTAGTRFKSGKDATGVDLFYALDQDMVVHKASIASLKGLFLESQEFPKNEVPTELIGLLASPIANSLDGQGKEFPKELAVKAWLPFGGPGVPTSQTTQAEEVQSPQGIPAQLGVAIASDILLLQEGERTITLVLTLENFQPPDEVKKQLKQAFVIYLSGEKEWILAQATSDAPSSTTDALSPTTDAPSSTTDAPSPTTDAPSSITDAPSSTTDAPSPTTIESVCWDSNDSTNTSTLEIKVKLTAEVDPILPYDPSNPIPFDPDTPNLPLPLERPMPVLRLELTNHSLDGLGGPSAYHYFRTVQLTKLTITADVPEVRNLVVQTENGLQDTTQPFQPFGPRPKNGATLYIGSQEALSKHLTKLTLHLEPEVLPPSDWADFYSSYDSAHQDSPSNFPPGDITVAALRQKKWNPPPTATLPSSIVSNLFNKYIDLSADLKDLKLETFAQVGATEIFTSDSQNGFLRLQLLGNFLHDEYPTVLARQVLASATNQPASDLKGKILGRQAVIGAYYRENGDVGKAKKYYVSLNAEPILPKEPYTPVIRSIHLDYTAQAKLSDCQLFRLYPFGGFEAVSGASPQRLLPSFVNEGELLIGIADLDPPTALPLLFQVAEDTADTGLRRTEAFQPRWFYLRDNTWVPLGDLIASDTTNGLIRSGIVNLGIPEDISKANTTILDPTLHWVKVSVPGRTRTVCHIIGVHTQAARVTFMDGGNDPNHLAVPLPAGTIAKLERPQAAITGIEQPYASVDGRVPEPPNQFYTRVSEHLRHKGRAVTIFDYERLVLEQFPDIYKVRCLNHGQFDDATNELFEVAPGSVTMAVIPDLSQRSSTDDLQPKVHINRLQAIETYLNSLSSSWATVKVVNPQYELIQVSFEVKFRSPYNANFGYYQRELQRAIVGFLTPWTIDQSVNINFGGTVYRSAILNFVEEQEYVDYVVNFTMVHNKENVQEAIASTARSLLTSVPYDDHIIKELKEQSVVPIPAPLAAGILGYEPLDNLVLGSDNPEAPGN